MLRLPFLVSVLLAFTALASVSAADDWQQTVKVEPVEGISEFHLWIPEGLAKARAAFLFVPHGSYGGYSISPHLRNLARSLECAVILSDKGLCGANDNPERVFDAMRALATASGHPEVANLPLIVFGHSNSTQTMGTFARQVPERIVTWIATKSAFGGQFEHPELARIPGMVVCGEMDHSYFSDQLATVKRMRRERHALVHILIEAEGPHWPTDPTFEIQASFITNVFYRRVPYTADATLEPPHLIEIEETSGWLGQNLPGERILHVDGADRNWSWDRPVQVKSLLEIAAFADFPGNAQEASWFPSQDYARAWQTYCATLSTRGATNVSPALIAAWKASREPSNDSELDSEILPDAARRLASGSSYERGLKDLRKITGDTNTPDEVTEATRLIARVETMADERLSQAQRLEQTHFPTAVTAYQQLSKRFAGTAAASTARERLTSKEFKQLASDWSLVARMRDLVAALKPTGARKTADDPDFAKANSSALQELRALGIRVLKSTPDTPLAAEAQAICDRFGIPLPAAASN